MAKMKTREYFARFVEVRNKDGSTTIKWQFLKDHLENVSRLAEEFAIDAGGDLDFRKDAKDAGLSHDIGKYQSFQDRLRLLAKGSYAQPVRHAFHGALLAYKKNKGVSFAVYGHHAGMPDNADLDIYFKEKENQNAIADLMANRDFQVECPWLPSFIERTQEKKYSGASRDLRIRMLLSCLVDADRIDSAKFEYGSDHVRGISFDAESLNRELHNHVRPLSNGAEKSRINRIREEVFQRCIEGGEKQGRLFSLTVPTGGGKTLSAMAFALSHALSFPEDVRRIIVVIPYLSIIEQNAKVLRDVFGKEVVLEHHSGDFRVAGQSKTETEHDENTNSVPSARGHAISILRENWDAPIVVTTSVRFFESLFSNKPGDLRRAHNIARSVVIFDEVQTFPKGHIEPILSMIKGMAEEWGTTFLFCTATQPAFERSGVAPETDRRWNSGTITPVLPPDYTRKIFQDLRRVKDPEWPTKLRKTSWGELAQELLTYERILCIVNTRPHAIELYQELERRIPQEALDISVLFHLSTLMCPRHRLAVLDVIRKLLKETKKPCIVVSTQLVEAGVDIDFPVVYRAFGPFDSMIQAAGRCNREGKLNGPDGEPGGEFHVFNPEEEISPYPYAIDITRTRTSRGSPSLHEPDQVTSYFDQLYSGAELDMESIEAFRSQLCFATVAQRFELIRDTGIGVIVLFDAESRELLNGIVGGRILTRSEFRGLQQYTVSLSKSVFERSREAGRIVEIREGSDMWCVLPEWYSPKIGVLID
jgi:CRISPR-associated endonuclease/helicase Cas3